MLYKNLIFIIFLMIIIFIIIYKLSIIERSPQYIEKYDNNLKREEKIKILPFNCSTNNSDNSIQSGIYSPLPNFYKFNVNTDVIAPPSEYYSIIKEINNDSFQKILDNIVKNHSIDVSNKKFYQLPTAYYDYWQGLFNPLGKTTIGDIKNNEQLQMKDPVFYKCELIGIFLIKILNKYMKKAEYKYKFSDGFEISDYSLITIERHKNIFKYVFKMLIYRRHKITGFVIYIESYTYGSIKKKINSKIYFNNLKILGNVTTDKISNDNSVPGVLDILSINNNSKQSELQDNSARIWWKLPYKNYLETDNDFKNIILPKNIQLKYLNDKFDKDIKIDESNYLCHSKDGKIQWNSNNKIICESDVNFYGNFKEKGTWDKECRTDTDCPFFKSNKNYENSFGGCYNGNCDLPVNMQLFGNTNYLKGKKYKPYCYNCPDKKLGDCCDLQNNTEKYPLLESPDYAFSGDNEKRFIERYALKSKGLDYKSREF